MAKEFLDQKGWQTPHSYSNTYAPLPRGSAVYAIVRPIRIEDEHLPYEYKIILKVLYVGMSTNLKQRFINHQIKRYFDDRDEYVQVWFQRTPKHKLRDRERRLIKRFNPPYNIVHRVRGEMNG